MAHADGLAVPETDQRARSKHAKWAAVHRVAQWAVHVRIARLFEGPSGILEFLGFGPFLIRILRPFYRARNGTATTIPSIESDSDESDDDGAWDDDEVAPHIDAAYLIAFSMVNALESMKEAHFEGDDASLAALFAVEVLNEVSTEVR